MRNALFTQHAMAAAVAWTVACGTTGCVSLSTYEELSKSHAQTKTEVVEARLSLAAKERELAASAGQVGALRAEVKTAEDLCRTLQTQVDAAALERDQLKAALQSQQAELAGVLKDRSALKGSVDEMRRALDDLARRKTLAEARLAEYRGLLARFQTLIDAGKLKVKIAEGRMVVALSSDILFASGSAALSKDGKQSVLDVAAVLATIVDKSFQVEGHTDDVPIKTAQFPSNWELASARALTVLRTLTEGGLPAPRVSAASFGEEHPVADNKTAEGRSQNRRIEIVVVPDLSALPGFDELKAAGG